MFSSSRPQAKTSGGGAIGAMTLFIESSEPQTFLAEKLSPVSLIGSVDLAEQVRESRHSLLPRREGVYPGELFSSARSRPPRVLFSGYSPAAVGRPLLP